MKKYVITLLRTIYHLHLEHKSIPVVISLIKICFLKYLPSTLTHLSISVNKVYDDKSISYTEGAIK